MITVHLILRTLFLYSSVMNYQELCIQWLPVLHAELINGIHLPIINMSNNSCLVSTNEQTAPGSRQVSGRVNGSTDGNQTLFFSWNSGFFLPFLTF